jgi:endonuclease G, mitochondrial
MKKLLVYIFVAISAFASFNADAWTQRAPQPVQACAVHAPFGFPQVEGQVQPICREAYLVGYDAQNKIPRFVMWTLTPQHALGCVARTNAFAADQSVPNGAVPGDYAATGYDKGHMAPDGDQSWDVQVEFESFLMTNMAPQAGSLNRGIWKLLETSVRGWAFQGGHNFTIVSGSVYQQGDLVIGKGVIVPHAFYKIVIDEVTGQAAGWWFPHVKPYPNLGNDLTKFRMPIAQIEQQAGVRYAIPAGIKEVQPGQEWPVDFGKLTNSKRQLCGANASAD